MQVLLNTANQLKKHLEMPLAGHVETDGAYPSYNWVHPWMNRQFIAGPYVRNCGFGTLLKGTLAVL